MTTLSQRVHSATVQTEACFGPGRQFRPSRHRGYNAGPFRTRRPVPLVRPAPTPAARSQRRSFPVMKPARVFRLRLSPDSVGTLASVGLYKTPREVLAGSAESACGRGERSAPTWGLVTSVQLALPRFPQVVSFQRRV